MCDNSKEEVEEMKSAKTIPVADAIGMVLAHDITEIRPGEFKGRAFKKGHIIKEEDLCHLQRLGKEHLFVLAIEEDDVHEDDAAYAIASSLMGAGVEMQGEPKEGKITIVAQKDGLLKVHREALLKFNMLGDVMCATLHNNSVVRKGQIVGGTRAIPLVVKKQCIRDAVDVCKEVKDGIISVKELRKPKAGVVITGNEVYFGRVQDAFAPIIADKIRRCGGEVVGIYYAPDKEEFIRARITELIGAGADLIITTGGMSVDPDDVTRHAIRNLGVSDLTYGAAVLPGAMFLIAYMHHVQHGEGDDTHQPANSEPIPVVGIPACGMYHKTTIFDLVLPRILAGERIGSKELSELGHGGLCLDCKECRYPVCPFGK